MEQEYIIEYYPPRNAGGQHVGIISKGIKITHIPSGLIAISECERSQLKNKNIAMGMIEYGLALINYQC